MGRVSAAARVLVAPGVKVILGVRRVIEGGLSKLSRSVKKLVGVRSLTLARGAQVGTLVQVGQCLGGSRQNGVRLGWGGSRRRLGWWLLRA